MRVATNLDMTALRTFLAVSDLGGFHRAAGALHVSQSTVSDHVRKLEAVVGAPLVRRQGRGSVLTHQGEQLVVAGRRLLRTHDRLIRSLTANGDQLVNGV
jgi:molybdate transport repressor ModE-like protein